MQSIRIKITAVTIAAILTSLLAFIGIGFFTIGEENDKNSVEKMNLLSENLQKSVDLHLNSLKLSVDMAANIAGDSLNTVKLSDFGAAGKQARTPEQVKQLDEYMAKHCEEVRHAFSSIANHTSGIVTYYYCISPDIGTSEHGFFYSKVGNLEFEEQPKLIASELDPNDIEHTTWYYSPIKRGRAVWVGPYKAHFLNELWTISYVTPIYKDGILIGVMGMDTLLSTVRSPIQAVRVYDTGFACLLYEEGHILAHPKLRMGQSIQEVSKDLDPEIFHRENNGKDLIRYEAGGQRRQMSFTTLSNGLKLVVTAPVSEIFASWRQMTQFILLVAIAILAVFTVLTLLLVGAVTQPLLRLAVASQKLANGDYDTELDYKGQDEVGMLTNSFRQMRDHMKLYISDLNSRAFSDALTGIKNKGAFEIYAGRMNDAIKVSEKGDHPQFAVVMFDCNRLKPINDEFGHERGDIYLRTASTAICKTYAHSPVFRLGGDEFAVLLQKQDYENRVQLLTDFDRRAEEVNAATDNPWEKINVAKGMAEFDPNLDSTVEQVLRRADERMYEDKRQHKVPAPEDDYVWTNWSI